MEKKYLPDFLFIDDINKIYIDIEVDECYVFEENTPIHYYHLSDFNFKKEPLSIDFQRDIDLVVEGCNVIRFSEKQIIQQPRECCKFSGNCIDYLAQNNTYSKKFSPIIELSPDDVWSFSTSKERANAKYRDEIKSEQPNGFQRIYNTMSESYEKEYRIKEQKNNVKI